MFEQIDGMMKLGLIEPTTGAKYKSEANLILHFIDDVPVHKITAAMVRRMDQDMLAKGVCEGDSRTAAQRPQEVPLRGS